MTDYGDEASYKLPWEIFDKESAESALAAARKCQTASEEIVQMAHKWRSENMNP